MSKEFLAKHFSAADVPYLDEISEEVQEALGLEFMPKRILEIPDVSRERLGTLYSPQHIDQVLFGINGLNNFLTAIPISDRFGKDHRGRRSVRDDIFHYLNRYDERLAILFFDLYANGNQLKANSIIASAYALETLIRPPIHPDYHSIKELMKEISDDVNDRLVGTVERLAYEQIPTNIQKLEEIHEIEDNYIRVLTAMAS